MFPFNKFYQYSNVFLLIRSYCKLTDILFVSSFSLLIHITWILPSFYFILHFALYFLSFSFHTHRFAYLMVFLFCFFVVFFLCCSCCCCFTLTCSWQKNCLHMKFVCRSEISCLWVCFCLLLLSLRFHSSHFCLFVCFVFVSIKASSLCVDECFVCLFVLCMLQLSFSNVLAAPRWRMYENICLGVVVRSKCISLHLY